VGRTNIDIDDELIAKVMRLYNLRTKREAIDFALRKAVEVDRHKKMLEMRGSGWGEAEPEPGRQAAAS
jgi:Arc/MetJ family transcription regulator